MDVLKNAFRFAYTHTVLPASDALRSVSAKIGREREITRMGGRIYYQVEDSVTEDMASGEKYHRLGYLSIFSPGIYEIGKGPLGLRDFMKTQVHRWARGGVGELRLTREKGSISTMNSIISNQEEFSANQKTQYFRTMTYYLSAITNVITMASPILFLTMPQQDTQVAIAPIAIIIGLQLLIRTWLYPASNVQRGGSFYESFSLIGLTLINWQRWCHAIDNSIIKKTQGAFGVTRKEGPNIKIGSNNQDFLDLGIGPYLMTFFNYLSFPLGLFLSAQNDNILPAMWGSMGLYFASMMTLALNRYNKGALPSPPQNGESILQVMAETNDQRMLSYLLSEIRKPEMCYSQTSIQKAEKLYDQELEEINK